MSRSNYEDWPGQSTGLDLASAVSRWRDAESLPWLRAVDDDDDVCGRVVAFERDGIFGVQFDDWSTFGWREIELLASTREVFGPDAGQYTGRILWRCIDGWRAISLLPGDPESVAVVEARAVAAALPWRPSGRLPGAGRLACVFGAVSARYRLEDLAA
jgi:hypothetical protein